MREVVLGRSRCSHAWLPRSRHRVRTPAHAIPRPERQSTSDRFRRTGSSTRPSGGHELMIRGLISSGGNVAECPSEPDRTFTVTTSRPPSFKGVVGRLRPRRDLLAPGSRPARQSRVSRQCRPPARRGRGPPRTPRRPLVAAVVVERSTPAQLPGSPSLRTPSRTD